MSQPPVAPRDKALSFAKENAAYNREWFADVRRRAAAGEPIAFVNADVPTELFKAMDMPVIVNQWWSAVVAAKQKSPQYLGYLRDQGYRANLCKYCSLAYASTFETDPAEAPWGGLPKPSIVVAANECNSQHKIFELWAKRFDVPFFGLDTPAIDRLPPAGWLGRVRDGWEDIFGTTAIDAMAAQYRELIAALEKLTGRTFDMDRLRKVMAISNEQEEYYARTRDLIAAARPAPINIADQMPATMIPQWHRGTEWGRDRARLFYEEVAAKVSRGEGAAADERVRLMWIGPGLWFNMRFYDHFQREHGAVFVWSMYLAIAADAYPAYGDDPLRALAGRMIKILNILHVPPYNLDWYVREAQAAGIDGVVTLAGGTDDDCRETFGYGFLIRAALERAGVPVLRLGIDNSDASAFDEARVTRRMEDFLARIAERKG